MQIDLMSCASPNVAPASETTETSPEAGKTPGSFADLLDAVAEDEDEATPADDADEDEPAVDGWMTVPVVVPIVPVIPQDVVKVEDGDATSVEAIGENIAVTDVDTPLPDVAVLPDVDSFVDGESPKPAEATKAESPAANEPQPPAPAIPAVDAQPGEIASNVRPEVTLSDTKIETTHAIASKEPIAAEPTATPAKGSKTAPAQKTTEVKEAAKAVAEAMTMNSAIQNAVAENVSPRAEAPANDTSSESAPSPKGVAARFARAIERAIEHAVAPAAGTDENSQSSNQNSGGQPSFGEWLREQLPQLTTARGHNAANPAFSLVAPAQSDARVSGVLASSSVSPLPGAPAMPNEHDVTLQLVQSMRMQFRDGIGEAVLKLKPEHLGSVSISLRVENGGLKANVQADMPAVRQWLESQQDTLRSALSEHGLRLDRFDVEPDAQRQPADDQGQREQSRKRQAQKREVEQPVFEVVV
jgi:flagellar hook-length control protein FliK